uniref:Uncharacterized protein n=1 Tax=Podoviridae sp. ctlpi2 TaxID=2826574 RepID=A0A8S5MM37_9CAUD|nr:MAG TPA: hypothetical protein [Podoviridae sp. ctlpi2]
MPGDITGMLDDIGSWGGGGGAPSHGDQVDKAAKVPEDNPKCRTTGVTDEGIIKSSRWKTLLSAAILAYNTLNSLRMAKLQRDLGKRYLQLAEDHRKYYNERYKPLETDLTKEALKLPKYVRDKDDFYAGQMLATVKGKNAGKIDAALTCTGRYCTGQRAARVTEQLLQQAMQESLAAGMAHRYADKEEIAHNNLRWEKREQVMRIGRDIPTEAVSYANLAAGIFGSLGKQAGKAAEDGIAFLAADRKETQYPPRRGPLTVSGYQYTRTPLEEFTPKPPDTYKPPEQTIKIQG